MTVIRVVDTDVAVAANGRSTHADLACQLACVEALTVLANKGKVVLDSLGLILSDYRGYLRPVGQPGVGDMFYKHILNNQYDPRRCFIVDIALDSTTDEFKEFPSDPALAAFDPDDRKFVAAALATGKSPPI